MLYHRIKVYKRRILLMLAIVLILAFVLFRYRSVAPDVPMAEAIRSVSTQEKVCAVTISLTGIESEESLRLLTAVCQGTGIKPCIFVTTEWLEDHEEWLPLLSCAELGLLFEESPKKWTQKRTMTAIAEANETFMTYTGGLPKLVRIASDASGQSVSVALNSYGQILIGSSLSLREAPSSGGIVDCGLLDSTTGFTLAQFYGAALSQGYTILPLGDLLAY